MSLPLTKKALKKSQRETAVSLPVVLEGETKSRVRNIALRAVRGDIDELDLANLDTLGRITGQLKNTYIQSLSAAKITSATMLATTLTLAGTDASANKTSLVMMGDALFRVNDGTSDRLRISNSGLELSTASEDATPESIVGRGISLLGASGVRVWPYDNTTRRGWQMRADGIAGGRNGRLTFIATRNSSALPTDTTSYANLLVVPEALQFTKYTNAAGVSVRNALSVNGPIRGTGGIESDAGMHAGGNLSAGGSLDVSLGVILRDALRVAGSTVLAGVDATNIRNSGSYENTGNTAVFGGPISASGVITAAGLSVGSGNITGTNYNPGGANANFGGPITLGGTLINDFQRVSPSQTGAITSVSAGATVTLASASLDWLWCEVRWRVPGGAWRHTTGSLASTGVNVNSWSSSGASVTNNLGSTVEAQAMFWR